MQQSELFNALVPAVLTVAEVTRHLRELMESDPLLSDIWLRGEISNLTLPTSGHIYFTLKDEMASIRCVIWKNSIRKEIRLHLQEGAAVEAHGSVGIYERSGQYQLYVDALRPAGEGALFQEFLRLKGLLEAEGLFAAERKRPIPTFPRKIGLVTSPTGAALQDMLNILRHRFPLAEVVLAGTAVQGEAAPEEIVKALNGLNQRENPDVILVARGGGSLEDLWAFNDERVVRAISSSRVPIITGIGHETDFTLSDFAADLRAPTPTAAAVAATPDINDLRIQLDHMAEGLANLMEDEINERRNILRDFQYGLEKTSPQWMVSQALQHLDELGANLARFTGNRLEGERKALQFFTAHLQSLDTQQILKRGYALVNDSRGKLIVSIRKVTPGQKVTVRLQDGRFGAGVYKTEPDSKIDGRKQNGKDNSSD
jgi:exodeoxyribonuclease VII large subunit